MACEASGRRLRVAVLFGGRSGEHEVSVASARSVVANLDPEKYDVMLLGITKDGRWQLPAESQKALTEGPARAPGASAILPADYHAGGILRLGGNGSPSTAPIDVVIPVLHGTYGEDGTVQGLLDLAGLPYVGAGVLGSAVGMDKVVMKTLFRAAGLPVPDFVSFKRHEWQADPDSLRKRIAEELGYPCFVKPANLGSSVGISKVCDETELDAAIDLAAEYDLKVIVERSVQNAHELECGVLGNDDPQASVVGEVIPSRDFYSYEAKYIDDKSEVIIPADLPEDLSEQIRALSVRAFQVAECAGLARVDFLVTRDTHEVFVIEINTLPGFTQISMYPKLWEASGVSYRELIDRLIELALEHHAQRESLRTSYT
ncbi:MAG: D-alanine--D-alanine ligase family protein [Armatimonadia bacterium]